MNVRQLLVVLQQTVNLFPSGKHRRFDSFYIHRFKDVFILNYIKIIGEYADKPLLLVF